MQSISTTHFRQKKCPRCGNNHDNDGVLCSFCVEKEESKRKKAFTTPSNCWVRCLIEREGDTALTLGTIQYTFKRNEHGHSVCEIINTGHYHQIIKSGFYEPYVEPIVPAEETPEPDNNMLPSLGAEKIFASNNKGSRRGRR